MRTSQAVGSWNRSRCSDQRRSAWMGESATTLECRPPERLPIPPPERGCPPVLLRRLLAVLATLVVAGTLALVTGDRPAQASGSGELMPTTASCRAVDGACRLTIEWRTSGYGPTGAQDTPLRRRTMFSVFARAGE